MTKNREILFFAQNCLNRIMILDYTKKTNNREIIFRLELSEPNNEPTFRLHQKKTKNRGKNEKLFLGQNFLNRIMSQS